MRKAQNERLRPAAPRVHGLHVGHGWMDCFGLGSLGLALEIGMNKWPYFVDVCEPSTPHPESMPIVQLRFHEYERARVCVNALADLNQVALDGGWNYKDQNAYTVKLEQKCEVLKKALNDLVVAMDSAYISSWQSTAAWSNQLDAARAAIAKAEGKGDE